MSNNKKIKLLYTCHERPLDKRTLFKTEVVERTLSHAAKVRNNKQGINGITSSIINYFLTCSAKFTFPKLLIFKHGDCTKYILSLIHI